MEDNVVLSVKDLHTYFYTNQRCNKVLNGVSFEAKAGRTLCIVGESGCGKSVTVSSILQLLPRLSRIESGNVEFYNNGSTIRLDQLKKNGKQMQDIRGNQISMIFQDPMTALNPVHSIGKQISENILRHTEFSRREAMKKTISLLGEMGIPKPEDRVRDYPHQFSGGMRQRAMIAMAMSCNPSVLIADEPTTALDVTVQAQIFELMEKLKYEYRTSIIMITHDMGVVSEMADDVLVMYMGYVVESGTAREVLRNPLHPYTQALLRSIPIVGKGHTQKLVPIRGTTANPYDRPPGCQFAPRCDYADKQCQQTHPKRFHVEGTHEVSCFKRIGK